MAEMHNDPVIEYDDAATPASTTPEVVEEAGVVDVTISESDEFEFAERLASPTIVARPTELDGSQPLVLDLALIEPGFGNSKDNFFYPRETLTGPSIGVFDKVKVHQTNHNESETNDRNWVATITEIGKRFTGSGAPVARVGVHDPYFIRSVLNLKELGLLEMLQCSIKANGRAKPGTVDGKNCLVVQEFTKGLSVDFVTRAGAGGRVLGLPSQTESAPPPATNANGTAASVEANTQESVNMNEQHGETPVADPVTETPVAETPVEETPTEETPTEPTSVAAPAEAPPVVEEAEPTPLTAAQVIAAIAGLPNPSQTRLSGRVWLSEQELATAVVEEAQYVQQLTGAGTPPTLGQPVQEAAPFGTNGDTAPQRQISEEDRKKRLDKILYG